MTTSKITNAPQPYDVIDTINDIIDNKQDAFEIGDGLEFVSGGQEVQSIITLPYTFTNTYSGATFFSSLDDNEMQTIIFKIPASGGYYYIGNDSRIGIIVNPSGDDIWVADGQSGTYENWASFAKSTDNYIKIISYGTYSSDVYYSYNNSTWTLLLDKTRSGQKGWHGSTVGIYVETDLITVDYFKLYYGTGTETTLNVDNTIARVTDLATVATSGSYNDLSNKPTIPTTASDIGAQEALVSGTNIKTINNTSILGSGNIAIAADNIFIAVYDSTSYADVKAAYDAGKTIFAKYNPVVADDRIYVLTEFSLPEYFQFTRIIGSSLQTLILDSITGWEISSVSINDKTLTIQKNGTDVATFTANSSSDVTANITVPTNTNELTNGAGFITSSALSGYVQSTDLATVATSGSYNDLSNKPTIPAAQVQSDWNETNTSSKAYILNKPTIPAGVVVDQTYNGTSANAQSGVAIAGAGFLTGITSGMVTTALGYTPYNSSNPSGYQANVIETVKVNGTALTVTSKAVDVTVPTKVSDLTNDSGYTSNIGTVTKVNNTSPDSNGNVTISIPSVVTETTVSGWGFTKNTGTVTSVNNVSPVNGNVSLTIPDAQIQSDWNQTTTTAKDYIKNKPTIPTVNNATLTIQKNGTTVKTFTANASSNVTCNITVPTKTSDLTNDSSFVTTDTQDTCGAANTTSKIYLVGRTAQSTGTSNSNSSVYTENGYLYAKTPSASSNTTSVATTKWVTDKGYTSNVGTVTSVNSTSPDANGNVSITIPTVPTNISAFTNDSGYITGITSSNVTTALGYTPADTDLSNLSATGKTVLDGQWVINEQQIYSGSLNSSTALDKTVTLPNDNHIYEVLISGEVETGTTSGNLIAVILKSNILTKYASVCAARTRASSTVASRGSIIIPMKYGSNNLTIYRGTGYNGTATIYSVAYRRCGTNT